MVLVDFWTYSCIHCVRTLPHVVRWYEKYRDPGFVAVGVHSPEFAYEKSTRNVQDAIQRFGIRYPVAQDNGFTTWKACDKLSGCSSPRDAARRCRRARRSRPGRR